MTRVGDIQLLTGQFANLPEVPSQEMEMNQSESFITWANRKCILKNSLTPEKPERVSNTKGINTKNKTRRRRKRSVGDGN